MTVAEAVDVAAGWLAASHRTAGRLRYTRFCWGLRTAFQLELEQARLGRVPFPAAFPQPSGHEVFGLVERWLVVFGPADGVEPHDRDECVPVLVDEATGQVAAGWPEPWLDGKLWWCLSPVRQAEPGAAADGGGTWAFPDS